MNILLYYEGCLFLYILTVKFKEIWDQMFSSFRILYKVKYLYFEKSEMF